MKYFAFLIFLFCNISIAQPQFYYRTSDHQSFRIRPGTHHTFHYIQLDRGQIATNTLFEIDNATKKLIIPQNGFYEITATFHFNPHTSTIKNNRGGVNFGIVQISEDLEQYVAATRKSFNEDNQDGFSTIKVYPTIVYLQEGVAVAPAINSGLMGNVLLGCEIGCEKKNKNCTSFEWYIKRISDEDAYQKYY